MANMLTLSLVVPEAGKSLCRLSESSEDKQQE
jgi:hypothetical protein